jgi:hypothetical protein
MSKKFYTPESLDLRGCTVRLRGQAGEESPVVTIPKDAHQESGLGYDYIVYLWSGGSAFQNLPGCRALSSEDVVEILPSSPPEPKEEKKATEWQFDFSKEPCPASGAEVADWAVETCKELFAVLLRIAQMGCDGGVCANSLDVCLDMRQAAVDAVRTYGRQLTGNE